METDARILGIIKQNVEEILPDVDWGIVRLEESLANLGANSIDRAEIVTMTMEELGVSVPLVELSKPRNIQSLVDLFHQYV